MTMPSEPNTATIDPTPAPRTKNVLKTLEIVALHTWITAHAADCRTLADAKLAQIAATELEFTITTANFSGMREEIGILKAKKATPPTLEERVLRLEEQVAGMATHHENVEALLQDLRTRGGLPESTPPVHPVLPDTGTIDLPLQLPTTGSPVVTP